jgi:predicted DCC family thiol-disulfide oxidoreductase YuxK
MAFLPTRTDKKGELLLLYDGECVLCNSSVDFLLRRDIANIFLFGPLQGETGETVLKRHGLDPTALDTIVYVRDYSTDQETVYQKSTAVLQALDDLGGVWRLISWLRIMPEFIRDWLYDIVADNRYNWFGKYDECRIPDTAEQDRFME